MTMVAVLFIDRVAEILTRYSMLPPDARIGVAVSGGADSVVLLHVLHRLSDRFRVTLAVLHLNHKLRGAESDADEQFVRDLGSRLGLPVFSESASLPGGNLEQEARLARRNFFARMRQREELERMALGHTRSDQAETILLRLLRGSGVAGLCGMRFVTDDHLIRPLLDLGRDEIRAWARSEGVEWREDSSNEDCQFNRNRVRNQTLPALTADYNSNLETVLAKTAGIAQAEEDYWSLQIGPICERITRRNHLGLLVRVPELVRLHTAVQRRVIRGLILRLKGDLRSVDLAHIEAISALLASTHGHDRVLLPGIDAVRSFDTLLLTRPGKLNADERQYCRQLLPGEWVRLPAGAGSIRFNYVKSEAQFCDTFKSEEDFPFEVAEISRAVLTDAGLIRPLYVRNWEPGDQIQRPGHSRPEKLKTLFGEYRILLWERRHWPVVVCDEEIVWAKQFGCSSKIKASGPEAMKFRLEYSGSEDVPEL